MRKTCATCGIAFEITQGDFEFYEKVSPIFGGKKELIPPPTLCPLCRVQRRLVFRNQTVLFKRQSSEKGEKIFSQWPDNTSFPVYDNVYWHEGDWDAFSYRQDVDLATSIFMQLKKLYDQTPKIARSIVSGAVNSDYCNNGTDIKNCYLVFGVTRGEDCMCSEICWYSRDCYECSQILNCELCFDCTACQGSYDVQSSIFSNDCRNSYFLMNCRSCENCFGCVNLRHAKYCMFNEQLSPAAYEKNVKAMNLHSYTARQEIAKQCFSFFTKHPRPHAQNTKVDDVTGNYISESKSVHDSFSVNGGENIRYGYYLLTGVKDSYDYSLYGNGAELVYESAIVGGGAMNILFCAGCYNNVSNLLYCLDCYNCSDCFCCSSLERKKYCILNKQYSEEEYERLVPKIIERMRLDGEWGEFFPLPFSAMSYNASIAQRFFPLSKEEATEKGVLWHESDALSIDDAAGIVAIPDTATKPAPLTVVSPFSGKPYRITLQEAERSMRFHVPLPRGTYNERMDQRMQQLGSMKMYDRFCAKTGKPIKTTISPETPWIVWDKDEYEKEFSA